MTSDFASLLNLHYHERYVIALWLAICKVGQFGQMRSTISFGVIRLRDRRKVSSLSRPQSSPEEFAASVIPSVYATKMSSFSS